MHGATGRTAAAAAPRATASAASADAAAAAPSVSHPPASAAAALFSAMTSEGSLDPPETAPLNPAGNLQTPPTSPTGGISTLQLAAEAAVFSKPAEMAANAGGWKAKTLWQCLKCKVRSRYACGVAGGAWVGEVGWW